LIPSTKRLAAGVASSVIHLGDTASALWGIGRAAASKIDGAAGRPQNEDEKAKIEAPLDALFESYKDKYRDMPSFLSYLAHDPAGVLADLSLIAGGGEIAAAKAGQMVGKAGELATRVGAETAGSALSATGSAVSGVGKAVGKVGTAINPLNPLGVLTPESSLISTSGRRAIGASGELTPKVDSMIQKVSDGVLSAADFRDPFARSQLVDVIRKKGLTPEAVKEGILRSQGLQTPSSVITGRAAPSAAYEANNLAIASNADALAGRARGIAGAEIMGPDIGAHLESAGVNSYNNAVDKYAAIRSTPGRFLPGSLGGTSWQSHLESELGRSGLPSNRELLEANGLENAAQAHDLINGVLNNGQRLVRTGGPLDAQEVLRLRQRLNDLAGKASGSDVKAVRDISTAFDNHLADAAEKGYFIDPANNQVNRNIAQNIRDASDAYKKHMNTFEVRNGANNNVVNAYKQLKSGFERDPEGRLLASNDSSLHQAAQATLERDLLNPSKGAITHSNLTNAMGGTGSLGEEAVNNYVRNAVMNSENNVLRPPKHIKQLLTDPNSVVHRAFLPEELSEVRKIHAAHNINSTRPTLRSQGESMLRGTIAPLAARAIAAPIGYHLAGFPGAIAGAAIEKGAESLLAKGAIKKALSGAPEKTGLVRKASKVVGKLTKPSSIAIARAIKEENDRKAEIARSQKLKEAAASGGRIERAAGGRASNHEALVARLMRMADQAKKATDKTTEPLLDAPDEAIVKALGVAQQAI